MDNIDALSRLKKDAIENKEPVVIKTIIDTIAAFGRDGIEPISEILSHSKNESVKLHGINVIRRIQMINP
ncbi:MAG TPA: hypothetical protein VH796_08060 [Nitrososphaeraceae archaeon]